jgi:hypothetical protein
MILVITLLYPISVVRRLVNSAPASNRVSPQDIGRLLYSGSHSQMALGVQLAKPYPGGSRVLPCRDLRTLTWLAEYGYISKQLVPHLRLRPIGSAFSFSPFSRWPWRFSPVRLGTGMVKAIYTYLDYCAHSQKTPSPPSPPYKVAP